MSFTRKQWATDFIKALGNKSPNNNTILYVCGWSDVELPTLTVNTPRFNLLATTWPGKGVTWNGSTEFNSVGVKNYRNYNDGIYANVRTIQSSLYKELHDAILTNNDAKLQNPTAGMWRELDTWGTGHAGHNINYISRGAANQNDVSGYGEGTADVSSTLSPSVSGDITQVIDKPDPLTAALQSLKIFPDWFDPMFIGKIIVGSVLLTVGLTLLLKPALTDVAKEVKQIL